MDWTELPEGLRGYSGPEGRGGWFLSGQEGMSEINPNTVFRESQDISSIRSKCFVRRNSQKYTTKNAWRILGHETVRCFLKVKESKLSLNLHKNKRLNAQVNQTRKNEIVKGK
jgi:hypothetical protein